MTQAEFTELLAQRCRLSLNDSDKLFKELGDLIKTQVLLGEKVPIFGVGWLHPGIANPRQGRNPRTGEKVAIPSRNKVSFKLSQQLKRSLNP